MRALVLLVALAACTPSPTPTPMPPDASDAATPVSSDCASACVVMASLHCSGLNARCPQVMANLEADRELRTPDGGVTTCACVAAAKTAAGVTACGVGCL